MDLHCEECGNQPLPSDQAYCPRCGGILSGGGLLRNRYRLIRQLGKGGFGTVYLAEDASVYGRRCAIKRIGPPEAALTPEEAELEGKILAQLHDTGMPGIPDLYESFSQNLSFFIVMRFIEGSNLAVWADTAQPDWRNILENIQPVVKILTHLHSLARPLAHGDIKPDNILRDSFEKVWLVDFGIAIPSNEKAEFTTRSNKGWSPGYSSWEQQYHGRITPKSDIHALGMTLFRLLAGPEIFGGIIRRRENAEGAVPGLTLDEVTGYPWSEELTPILTAATAQRPGDRPDGSELAEMIKPHLPTDVQPLPVDSGSGLRRPEDLVKLAEENYPAAIRILQDRSYFHWARQFQGDGGLSKRREDIFCGYGNPGEGLEAVLRDLDPGLPKPSIVMEPEVIGFGRVGIRPACATLSFSNATRGFAKLNILSPGPFLDFQPAEMTLRGREAAAVTARCNPHRIDLGQGRIDLPLDVKTEGHTRPMRITAEVPIHVRLWHRILRPALERVRWIWGLIISCFLSTFLVAASFVVFREYLHRSEGVSPIAWLIPLLFIPFCCAIGAFLGWPLGTVHFRLGKASNFLIASIICAGISIPVIIIAIVTAIILPEFIFIAFLSAIAVLTILALLPLDKEIPKPEDPYLHPMRLSAGLFATSALVIISLVSYPWADTNFQQLLQTVNLPAGWPGNPSVHAQKDCPFYSQPDLGSDSLGWYMAGDQILILSTEVKLQGWTKVSVPRQTGNNIIGWTRTNCLP